MLMQCYFSRRSMLALLGFVCTHCYNTFDVFVVTSQNRSMSGHNCVWLDKVTMQYKILIFGSVHEDKCMCCVICGRCGILYSGTLWRALNSVNEFTYWWILNLATTLQVGMSHTNVLLAGFYNGDFSPNCRIKNLAKGSARFCLGSNPTVKVSFLFLLRTS